MHIMIFTDSFLPKIDGVAVSVWGFSQLLAERGHRITICCPRYGSDDPAVMGENIRVLRFRGLSLPSYPDIKIILPSLRRIRKTVADNPPDLIHIQSPGLLGLYGILTAKRYGLPLVGSYHTLVSEQSTYISPLRLLRVDGLARRLHIRKKSKDDRENQRDHFLHKSRSQRAIQKICNMIYETNDLIITPSRLIKDTLRDQDVKTEIEVVSNGLDLQSFHGQIKTSPSRPLRLLHVGRISFEKNCEIVIEAFARVKKSLPDARLDIIGDGPALPSLKILAERLGLEGEVSFAGFVPRERLASLYPRYDIFLTASTMETQGLVVLEAIASGLPCAGVDAYALPELIRHGKNGFICRPFDPGEMAAHIITIAGDRRLYRTFSANGLQIAAEHDIVSCANRLEGIYYREIKKKSDIIRHRRLYGAVPSHGPGRATC